MARITRENVQKINSKCKNGWELDVEYYLYHGDKTLIKQIRLDDENYLQFAIRYNYKNQICLRISKYHHKEGDYFASSSRTRKIKVTRCNRSNTKKCKWFDSVYKVFN